MVQTHCTFVNKSLFWEIFIVNIVHFIHSSDDWNPRGNIGTLTGHSFSLSLYPFSLEFSYFVIQHYYTSFYFSLYKIFADSQKIAVNKLIPCKKMRQFDELIHPYLEHLVISFNQRKISEIFLIKS